MPSYLQSTAKWGRTVWRVVAAGVATLVLTVSGVGVAKADLITLNTGVDTSPPGGGEATVDHLWRVTYASPVGSQPIDATTITVTGTTFPLDYYWFANTPGVSQWITPSTTGRYNAPPGAGEPSLMFTYYTTLTLTSAEAAHASLIGRWSSDNGGVGIDVNGKQVWTGDTGATAYTSWHPVSIGVGAFQACLNTLAFQVLNLAQDSGNPTGFRFEGGLVAPVSSTPLLGIAPEPSTLLLGLLGSTVFGFHALRKHTKRSAA